jgi:hypothetical protein
MSNYIYGIKITLMYLLAWIFYNEKLRNRYGYKLFHWCMPYPENRGYAISIKHER